MGGDTALLLLPWLLSENEETRIQDTRQSRIGSLSYQTIRYVTPCRYASPIPIQILRSCISTSGAATATAPAEAAPVPWYVSGCTRPASFHSAYSVPFPFPALVGTVP